MLNNIEKNPKIWSCIAGASLTFAFAPFSIWPIAVLSLAIFFRLITHCVTLHEACKLGWLFGFFHFFTSLYWISNSLFARPEFLWLLPFALSLIPAVLGVYTALVACFTMQFKNSNFCVLAFACIWTIIEALRANFTLPFPWNLLGNAVIDDPWLRQIAFLFGLYGLSFMLAYFGAVVASRNRINLMICLMILLSSYFYGFLRYNEPSDPLQKTIKVKIIQPNLVEHHLGRKDKQDFAMKKLVALTQSESHDDNHLYVIWPEASFPYAVIDMEYVSQKLASILPKNSTLIFGADRIERSSVGKANYYNSIISTNSAGEVLGLYDKEILVPFGEYVPLSKLIKFTGVAFSLDGFSRGVNQHRVLKLNEEVNVAPLICYEAIFPNVVPYESGMDLLLNVTNDAWFGDTIGPQQHLAMVRMRAVEYGLSAVRSANSGISATISYKGDVIKSVPLLHEGVIIDSLPVGNKHITSSIIKEKLILIILLILAFIAGVELRRRKNIKLLMQ